MDSLDYPDSDDSNSSDDDTKAVPTTPKATDLGKKVIFYSGNDKKQKYGVLRFVGETEFAEEVWCGVELERPTGKNNGSVHGIRYFACSDNCGAFVPISKVELDTSRRCRSRPNSQPTSRATSVERKEPPNRPISAKVSAGNAPSVNKMGLSELVSRLSQPLRRSSHPASVSNRRQPMKAFATKGIGRDEGRGREEKKTLPPFRSGGIYKAASTENIRAMKDKDKTKLTGQRLPQGMPAKKSSSERDLRSAGKGSSTTTTSNGHSTKTDTATKMKWKPMRTSSCSDILDTNPPPLPSSPPPPLPSSTPPSSSTKSSTTSSTSHTSLESYPWPRTSTPGDRDELTPDGCSSPEESEDHMTKTASTSTASNKGVVEAPQQQQQQQGSGGQTPLVVTTDESGSESLASHVTRFTEAQTMSTTLIHQSIQSPDHGHTQKYFKNRPLGTATLDHPLTSAVVTDGAKLLKQLLGPNNSVSCWGFTSSVCQ